MPDPPPETSDPILTPDIRFVAKPDRRQEQVPIAAGEERRTRAIVAQELAHGTLPSTAAPIERIDAPPDAAPPHESSGWTLRYNWRRLPWPAAAVFALAIGASHFYRVSRTLPVRPLPDAVTNTASDPWLAPSSHSPQSPGVDTVSDTAGRGRSQPVYSSRRERRGRAGVRPSRKPGRIHTVTTDDPRRRSSPSRPVPSTPATLGRPPFPEPRSRS
jgi:hypothetical protein